MPAQIQAQHFTNALYALLDEAFDNVQGYFLDKGTSMFETLATISAEEASAPTGGQCATLAAKVKHVAFYLDVVERNMRSGTFQRVDWGEIWRTVGAVSSAEWDSIRSELRESYSRTVGNVPALHKDRKENTGCALTPAPRTRLLYAVHVAVRALRHGGGN